MGRPKNFPDVDIADLARKLFSYDPETGVLSRIARQTRSREFVALDEPEPTGHLKDGYLRVSFYGRSIYVHRLAWFMSHGEWPNGEIDHVNGDRSDNRLSNLRVADRTENSQNMRSAKSNNPHGVLGLNWHKGAGKWMAQITVDKQQKYLGLFKSADDARSAYLTAKRELHPYSTI